MAADGTDQRQLTTSAGLDEGPAWSPGGSRIAFTSARAGSSDIWTMAADGTDQQRLTALPGTRSRRTGSRCPACRRALGSRASRQRRGRWPRARLERRGFRCGSRRGQSLRTLGRKGLVVRIALLDSRAGLDARLLLDRVTSARLRLAASVTVGRASRTLRAAGTARIAIRLTRRARARLATVERAKLTLRITASTEASGRAPGAA